MDAVRNIADLRALDPVSHDAVQILGYHAVSDGGGGTFYFDPNLTAWAFAATNSDNGLSVTSSPFKTGDCIRLYGDSLPSGVSTGTDYYATRATGTGFKLATTAKAAFQVEAGITGSQPVSLTSDGSGSVNYADDSGTIITPSTDSPATGRWRRVRDASGPVYASWFGAMPEGHGITDSDNTDAIKRALAYCLAKSKLVFGPGNYRFDAQLEFLDLVVEGAGKYATSLWCTSQLGTGVPAIFMDNILNANRLVLRDINVDGPVFSGTLGTKVANCDGVEANTVCMLQDVVIRWFDSGFINNSWCGHVTLRDCEIGNNYYGVYFKPAAQGGTSGGGDFYVHGGNINGNRFANIAIAEDLHSGVWKIDRCHMGFAPYGIYQEAGPSTDINFLVSAVLTNAYFEAIGNAAIFTEKWDQRNSGVFSDVTIQFPGFSWIDDYKLPDKPRDYPIQVGLSGGVHIFSDSHGFRAGELGGVYVDRLYGPWFVDLSHDVWAYPPFDITWGDGIPEMVHWIPADYSAGRNFISKGTTSRVIKLRYAGPLEALRPHVTVTSPGGLANPQLYVSNKSYDPVTGNTSFTVSVPGGNPSYDLSFDWSIAK